MAGEYKIKDLEILTGIKAHTLRIWEKRYNLLSPERTETQIRTYSEQDLLKLLNISILYKKGMKISKIAQLEEEQICGEIKTIYDSPHSCGIDMKLLFQATIELKCSYFDAVLKSMMERKGLEKSYRNCLRPFLERIDSLWKTEGISQVQKHFVLNRIRQKLIAEIESLPVPEKEYFDAVLFTPEGEYFEMDLLFYNYILKKNNHRTLYLGTSLPINDLELTLKETNPKSIVLCIQKKGKYCYLKYMDDLIKKVKLPIYLGGNFVDNQGKDFYKIENLAHVEELICS